MCGCADMLMKRGNVSRQCISTSAYQHISTLKMFPDYSNITLQNIQPAWLPPELEAAMLRLDRLHPDISGNKWFKLKYNLAAAQAAGKTHIVTFGGAWSNHIAATAVACRMAGLPCTGIIRGEAALVPSHTLQQAGQQGMQLRFISREAYREKDRTDWEQHF